MKQIKIKKQRKWTKWFVRVGEYFCNLLFPEDLKCIFCGKDVPDFQNKPFCNNCEKNIVFNNGNRCLICDEPIANEAHICDRCQRRKFHFKKAFCPFVYEGVIRSGILSYKEDNQRFKAKTFAKYIANEIKSFDLQFDIITYIPMTPKKEKARSFNQAKLLAQEIGKIFNVEIKNLFTKTRDDTPQKFLNYAERLNHLNGMYVLNEEKLKPTDRVLIVDDILTTCSTVDYCASLINQKVKDVYVCGIARNKIKQKQTNEY